MASDPLAFSLVGLKLLQRLVHSDAQGALRLLSVMLSSLPRLHLSPQPQSLELLSPATGARPTAANSLAVVLGQAPTVARLLAVVSHLALSMTSKQSTSTDFSTALHRALIQASLGPLSLPRVGAPHILATFVRGPPSIVVTRAMLDQAGAVRRTILSQTGTMTTAALGQANAAVMIMADPVGTMKRATLGQTDILMRGILN